MRKTILMLLILASAMITPTSVFAQKEAGASAMIQEPLLNAPNLKIKAISAPDDVKKATIRKVLDRYNTPLTDDDIDEFIKQSKDLDMNPYLLPAISIVESSACTALLPNSHNCYGWGGGYIYFPSYKEAIITVAQALKKNYIGKGAVTVESVGKIYSESDLWPQKVRRAMRSFEEEEQKNQLLFASNPVK
jgi:hypothetical protein